MSSDLVSLIGFGKLNRTCQSLLLIRFSHLILKLSNFERLLSEISTLKNEVAILIVDFNEPCIITLADLISAISYLSFSTGPKL